jgi:hypothetical protein
MFAPLHYGSVPPPGKGDASRDDAGAASTSYTLIGGMNRVLAITFSIYLALWSRAWCCCSVRSLLGQASATAGCCGATSGPAARAAARAAGCPHCIAGQRDARCDAGEGEESTRPERSAPTSPCRCHEIDRSLAPADHGVKLALQRAAAHQPWALPSIAFFAGTPAGPFAAPGAVGGHRGHAPLLTLLRQRTLLLV